MARRVCSCVLEYSSPGLRGTGALLRPWRDFPFLPLHATHRTLIQPYTAHHPALTERLLQSEAVKTGWPHCSLVSGHLWWCTWQMSKWTPIDPLWCVLQKSSKISNLTAFTEPQGFQTLQSATVGTWEPFLKTEMQMSSRHTLQATVTAILVQ